jgi:hypothetical protein
LVFVKRLKIVDLPTLGLPIKVTIESIINPSVEGADYNRLLDRE